MIKIRNVFFIIMGLMLMKMFGQLTFDKRPFKFEHYKTTDALEKFIKSNFPDGSNLSEAIDILYDSGAQCIIKTKTNSNFGYIHDEAIFVVSCSYKSNFISFYQRACYDIVLQADGHLKIVHSMAIRTKYCGVFGLEY
jgi:hypothetical protein